VNQPILYLLLLTGLTWAAATDPAQAQLQRERATLERPVTEIFWASTNIGLSTVTNPEAGNLNMSVVHSFGPLKGGVDRFFGMDDGANTRIGLEYGFSDSFSAGIGRMTFDKVVDLRIKYNILRQTESGSTPADLTIKIQSGVNTTSGIGMEFSDRLSYLISLMAARKFNRVSLQLSPMMAHFNRTAPNNPEQLFGTGLLMQYELNDRFAVSGEYLPIFGSRHAGTVNTAGVALQINTGGHIFQLFVTNSQWHGEPYMMARTREGFFDGGMRFGFNIHRVFGLTSQR
jgi:hypothetical protein